MQRNLRELRYRHNAHETDEIDEATQSGRDGISAEGREANPESGVPVGNGNGGAVVSSGSVDRTALPEERQRPTADAVGDDVAYSLPAAVVWLL